MAFCLYHRMPFGRLHGRNPQIVTIAKRLGRTPSAVAMKACNFASLDPVHRARNIRGLGNAAQADRVLWAAFEQNSEAIAIAAGEAYSRLVSDADPTIRDLPTVPDGPTDAFATVKVRRVQGFFRATVLTSYDYQCALSDIAVPELLNASHIIPWSESVERRAHPSNGICLNALYDRAFDRGLIGFDERLRVLVSPVLKARLKESTGLYRHALVELEGRPLRLPSRFQPDMVAIAFHRERRFQAAA